MTHYSVCYDYGKGRIAVVMSFENEAQANRVLNVSDKARVGFVGGQSFAEAIKRVGMMERNESGAWGSIEVAR